MIWPFGPKAPCAHCGKSVGKPRDADGYLCPHCGHPGPWASTDQAEAWELADQTRRGARERYESILKRIISEGPTDALSSTLRETVPLTGYDAGEIQHLTVGELLAFAHSAVEDSILTDAEENRLVALVPALNLSWEELWLADPGLRDKLVIASANAGRLPTVKTPDLLVKAGETVHLEAPASLMKEVTLREFRGGYQGFSFPLGKTGIRYKVGGMRGHSVVVGTEMQVADSGTLVITSNRAVFVGSRKTIEMQFTKLANLTVYSNGVQFHVTNRQSAPLFTVQNGEVVAAVVNAASQKVAQ